jgi:hypothetical protein
MIQIMETVLNHCDTFVDQSRFRECGSLLIVHIINPTITFKQVLQTSVQLNNVNLLDY